MSVATSPKVQSRKALAVERGTKVWDLRVAGASFPMIARQLGVGLGTAHRDFQRQLELHKVPSEQVSEYKATQLAAINRLLMEAYRLATGTTRDDLRLKAIREAVRLMERQARLLGLDAPVAIDAIVSIRDQSAEDLAAELDRILSRPLALEPARSGQDVDS